MHFLNFCINAQKTTQSFKTMQNCLSHRKALPSTVRCRGQRPHNINSVPLRYQVQVQVEVSDPFPYFRLSSTQFIGESSPFAKIWQHVMWNRWISCWLSISRAGYNMQGFQTVSVIIRLHCTALHCTALHCTLSDSRHNLRFFASLMNVVPTISHPDVF
jgi:hypothetical protein